MHNYAFGIVLSLIIGYLCGNLLSGYLLGKREHVDLRHEGSGNVGTTNTLRVLGAKAGAFTLVMDIMKAIIAVLIVWLVFHNSFDRAQVKMLELMAGFGAVLGHDFPFYMGFKGGKGIATSTGLIIALFPQILPVLVIIFVITVALTRYVSLGSILAAIGFFVEVIIFGQLGLLSFTEEQIPIVYLICGITCALALIRHRSNIGRLIHGKENKLSFHR